MIPEEEWQADGATALEADVDVLAHVGEEEGVRVLAGVEQVYDGFGEGDEVCFCWGVFLRFIVGGA